MTAFSFKEEFSVLKVFLKVFLFFFYVCSFIEKSLTLCHPNEMRNCTAEVKCSLSILLSESGLDHMANVKGSEFINHFKFAIK